MSLGKRSLTSDRGLYAVGEEVMGKQLAGHVSFSAVYLGLFLADR